jgi:hypothetical protein
MEVSMRERKLFIVLGILILISLACGAFGRGGSSGTESSAPGSSAKYDTEFPLPPKVENFSEVGNGSINFQTPMAMSDVIEFYRDSFNSAGYVERDITTNITDTTFSIVWDGHPSGQAVVVQGVDLGDGTVNVNVRLEDV